MDPNEIWANGRGEHSPLGFVGVGVLVWIARWGSFMSNISIVAKFVVAMLA